MSLNASACFPLSVNLAIISSSVSAPFAPSLACTASKMMASSFSASNKYGSKWCSLSFAWVSMNFAVAASCCALISFVQAPKRRQSVSFTARMFSPKASLALSIVLIIFHPAVAACCNACFENSLSPVIESSTICSSPSSMRSDPYSLSE